MRVTEFRRSFEKAHSLFWREIYERDRKTAAGAFGADEKTIWEFGYDSGDTPKVSDFLYVSISGGKGE